MNDTNTKPLQPSLRFASIAIEPELPRTVQGASPLPRLPSVALDRTFAVPVQRTTMEAKEEKRNVNSPA